MFRYFGGACADLLLTSISIVILKIYFETFFEQDKRGIIGEFFWIFYFMWQFILGRTNVLPAYINVMINVFLVSMLCINTYEGGILQKIVFSVLINTIWMLAEFLVGYMFVLCGIHYMVPQFWGSLFSKLFTLFMIICLKKFFQNENVKDLSNKYNITLLLIPIGSMFVVYNTFMLSVDINKKVHIKESLTSLIIILLINIVIFKLYLVMSKEKELEKYNAVYEQQLELCTQHMREKENIMMDFRNARHDIKQHVIVLIEMLDNNQNESAIDYLRKLINIVPLNNLGISRTDNIVVDSLINAKYAIALKEKIKFNVDIHIPMQLPFYSADLSILLGNILDNAIEASLQVTEDNRYIKLFMKFEMNVLIITVVNAYNGKLVKNRNGKIVTSKAETGYHGIGLESVQKVATKYHGSVVVETKQKVFTIKVILCDLS